MATLTITGNPFSAIGDFDIDYFQPLEGFLLNFYVPVLTTKKHYQAIQTDAYQETVFDLYGKIIYHDGYPSGGTIKEIKLTTTSSFTVDVYPSFDLKGFSVPFNQFVKWMNGSPLLFHTALFRGNDTITGGPGNDTLNGYGG